MLEDMKIQRVPRLKLCMDLPFCFEDCMVTICNYIGVDYELIFSRPMRFLFKKDACLSQIALQHSFKEVALFFSSLLEPEGITLRIHHESWKETLQLIQKECSSDRPVIVIYDSFWCPWDPIYKKSNREHTFIVIGLNHKTGNFICIDPYFDKERVELPIINMIRGLNYVVTYEKSGNKETRQEITPIDIEVENKVYKEMLITNLDDLHRFSEYVNDVTEIRSVELDFWDFPIFFTVNAIIVEHYKSLLYIQYSKENQGRVQLSEYEDGFYDILCKWILVRGLVIKVFCMRKTEMKYLHSLQEKIRDTICQEEKFFHELLKGQIGHEVDVLNPVLGEQEIVDPYYVDLQNALNNKAFDKAILENDKTDISGYGDYFLIEDAMPKNPWVYHDIKFYTSIAQNKGCDNIACNGQCIVVKKRAYKRIQIMACSEYGSYSDYIVFIGDGTKTVKIPLFVYDWADLKNTEKCIWCGRVSNTFKETGFIHRQRHKIYVIDYFIPNDLEVEKIKLPMCPNIHIFGITLGSD